MKKCTKCNQYKHNTEFSLHRLHKDGLSSHCKQCVKIALKEYREKNKEKCLERSKQYRKENKEKVNELWIKWKEKNSTPEKEKEWKKEYYLKNRKEIIDKMKEFRRNNPIIYKARTAVKVAVRNGTLIKADRCSICGSTKHIEGHHRDYKKPLDVLWVCSKCHKQIG